MAATPFHLVTGSDDSNVHVWAIPRLLELDPAVEHEPERTLSDHRAAVTSVLVGQSVNPDTAVCVSAGRDRSCIVWNYRRGVALRTLLFPAAVLSACLDPCSRAFYAASEDGCLYAVELFAGERPLLGPPRGAAAAGGEDGPTTAVQVELSSAFGAAPPAAGPPSCLAVSYDGTVLLSGHPQGQVLRWDTSSSSSAAAASSAELLTNLNASVTNLVFVPPLRPAGPTAATNTRPVAVVRPFLGGRAYGFTAQLTSDMTKAPAAAPAGGAPRTRTRFARMLDARGLPPDSLEQAILALRQPAAGGGGDGVGVGDQELRTENEELWEIVNEQRALQKKTLQRYIEARSANA